MKFGRRTQAPHLSLLFLAAATVAHGVDGTWSNPNGGLWSLSSNWAGGVVATGVDGVADFSALDLGANATVSLGFAATAGTLRFGDTTPSHQWTISNTGGGSLVMDVSAGIPKIQVLGNTVAKIQVPIAGNDGLEVVSAASGAFGGEVILSGNNSFTGGLTISGGRVTLASSSAAGAAANTITVSAAANPSISNQLAITGGFTFSNKVVIAAGASPLAGQGAVQQTGTGTATLNGTITINGAVASGGHFAGGSTSGNELIIGGVITSNVPVVQAGGRVTYRSFAYGYTSLVVNGAALIGANNGIAPGATLTVGDSADGRFTLGSFTQTLAGLQLGTSGGNANGTISINGTGRNLTLTGNLATAGNGAHAILGPSALVLGANTPNFTVADGASAVDLAISSGITGTGGFRKLGSGTMVLSGNIANTGTVTVADGTLRGTPVFAGPLVVENNGILAAGTLTSSGTVSSPSLTLNAGAGIRMKVGANGDLISVGALNVSGPTSLGIQQLGGALANGIHPILQYTGASPNLNPITLLPFGRATATLVDTGTAIALNITGNDKALWQGTNGAAWDGIGNWKLQSNLTSTNYIENDEVIFGDDPVSTTVTIDADVFPSRVRFANDASNYHLTGTAGIAGMSDLVKSGAGAVRISSVNKYVGATTIEGGTFELNRSSGDLSATSGVFVAPGAVFKLSHLNADMTFSRPISGAGTVILDPNAGGVAGARTITVSGINSGFSGIWKISPNSSGGGGLGGGTVRWQQPSVSAVGTGEIRVDRGGQFWAGGNTYSNLFRISGTGYEEALGGPSVGPVETATNGVYLGAGSPILAYAGLGALRLNDNSVLTGNVQVQGDTKIGILSGTGTIAGDISAGANDTLIIGGHTGSGTSTVILTGNNAYGRTIVNGGSGSGTGTHVLQIGNAGTTGTLGTGDVVLQGQDAATARIVFRRSDGYTLAPGQKITASASGSANLVRTQVVVNTTGAGLTLNNHEIDLSDGVFGGGLYVGGFQGVSGSKLNITGASIVDVGRFYLGYDNQISGTVIQSGNSTVKVLNHMRVGSASGARSYYELSGGNLDFTPVAVSPQFPYDSDYVTDDGGLWLGVQGAGTFHQTGGTLATNFLVLSYFSTTIYGDDPLREKDIYQLDGGTLLLKHQYGIISRREHAVINLNGGTIRAAAGVSPSLDSNRITVQAGGVTLDTNGPNTFTLYGPLGGAGTVNLIGGGTLRLSNSPAMSTGGSLGGASIQIATGSTLHADRDRSPDYGLIDVWTGAVGGAGSFIKEKTGHLVLAGNASSFTGTTTVLGGRLKVPANFGSPNVDISDGASFGGEPTTARLKLGETTGARLYFDPQTPGALSVSQLIIRGNSTIDFDTIPTSPGPWTVLNYVSRDLAGTFKLADADQYRPGSVQVVDSGSSITVNLTGQKSLTWTGASYNSWDPFGGTNWTDGATPQTFYHGDTVIFGDGTPGAPSSINVNRVKPWKTIINSDQKEYFLSASNGGISGPGSVEKLGAATATFHGENTYSGQTILSGGVLSIFISSNLSSIGDGSPTNGVVFNGGTLATEDFMELGTFRPVIVNASGGTMTANSTRSTGGFTLSGPLRGNGALTFTSATNDGSTHVIKGDVSDFHGTLIVKAFGPNSSGTTLRLADGVAWSGPVISVLPSVLTYKGNTSALDLVNASAGSGSTLELRSSIIGGVTQGSSLLNSTGTASWAGPIKLFGNGQTQLDVTGKLVINGGIASGGDFSGKFVLRGSGNGVLNGTIVLPGASVEKLAASTWQINSQNNQWGSTYLSEGVLRLGAHQALPPAASLTIVGGVYSTTLDLNGFDQKVTGLAVSGGLVTNSGPTIATLTIHQDTDTVLDGVFSGLLGIVKTGTGNMTFRNNNTFSGPLVINGGTVTVGNVFGTLGASNVAGRMITIGQGATLALQLSDVFGSGLTNETTMPLLRVNQGTLSSTVYNALGPLELNGGTLIHSNSATGGKQGYQFRGAITVGGAVPSVISSSTGKANHLSANSVFEVGDSTNDLTADLVVSNPLNNQSSDFSSAAGGLTKTGPGTMELGAINTYTGTTIVRGGTLLVTGSLAASSLTTVELGGTLTGTGTVGPLKLTGGIISPGPGPGSLSVGNLDFAGGSFLVGVFGANANQYDKLMVTGSATITSDTALNISLGYAPSNGDAFLLLSNDGNDAIGGAALFTVGGFPRPSGSPFVVAGLESGQYFELNYTGGDGNDVVLVTVPEAGSVALLLCGALTFCARRRR